MTLDEYKEALLREFDPDLLLELLQISAEDLLERFEDKVLIRMEVEHG